MLKKLKISLRPLIKKNDEPLTTMLKTLKISGRPSPGDRKSIRIKIVENLKKKGSIVAHGMFVDKLAIFW